MVWRRGFDASAVTLPERQNVSQKPLSLPYQDFMNRTSPVMMAKANRIETERVKLDRAPSP